MPQQIIIDSDNNIKVIETGPQGPPGIGGGSGGESRRVLTDWVWGSICFIGTAPPGTLTTEDIWKVNMITFDEEDNVVVITQTRSWDTRTSMLGG